MTPLLLATALGAALASILSGAPAKTPPPKTYSLTEHNDFSGAPEKVTFYRNGNIVVTDHTWAPHVSKYVNLPHGRHVRSFYDLAKQKGWSWDPSDASVPCTSGFGSWGNPFEWISQMFGGDLSELHPHPDGTETVAGRKAHILELTIPGQAGKVKIWLDAQYGLLLKMASPDAKGHEDVGLEVTSFSPVQPPAAEFAVPSRCPGARGHKK